MSTEFRTLNDIVRAFQDIGERHLQIKTFFVGQDFDLGNDTARNSILAVNPISAVLPKTEGGYTSYTVDFTVKVLDLVNKDMSNELEVMSDGLEILKDIVSELNTHPYYIESSFDIIGDVNFEPARGVFDSDLTGWECTFTLEAPNYRYFCGLPMDALNGQTYYPDLFSNIRNSDDTYNTTVIVSETLTLPDITHTDTDLSPVTLPAQTPMVCTPGVQTYPSAEVLRTGQTTSYRTGDDGDEENGRDTSFLVLANNNPLGNTNRLTDELGLQTYANDIVIDWSTHNGTTTLGYYVGDNATNRNWNASVDWGKSLSVGGFSSGWRLANARELFNICDNNTTSWLNYAPFNHALALWSSSSKSTTVAVYMIPQQQKIQTSNITASYKTFATRQFTNTELGF